MAIRQSPPPQRVLIYAWKQSLWLVYIHKVIASLPEDISDWQATGATIIYTLTYLVASNEVL
jgi:hypothetical protein